MQCWIILIAFTLGLTESTVQPVSEKCEGVEIMRCLSNSQSANEARVFFPDTQQKLRDYCKHLMDGLECTRQIIEECVSEQDRNVYHNLTHDMVSMNVALCTPGSPFSTRFLQHVDCYKTLSSRFRACSDRYIGNIVVVQSQTQEEQMKMTCCTVHEYSRCMRNAVDGRCEEDAQKLVEETVITALRRSFGYCSSQVDNVPTSNCLRTFSASKGHATGTLDDDYGRSASLSRLPWIPYMLLLCILFVS